MVELFKHLMPLDFKWIMDAYGAVIYTILFLVIFIETGLVAMPFLPGDSLLFMAGLFARSGELNLAYLFILLFIAAVLGDNCNYWIGRKIGLKIFTIKFRGKALVNRNTSIKPMFFLKSMVPKAIIMARFVPFVRTFAPFAAGIAQMDYRKYLLFDVVGGALWIGGLTTAGYLLGEVEFIRKHVDLVCLGIILVSVLPILWSLVKKQKQPKGLI